MISSQNKWTNKQKKTPHDYFSPLVLTITTKVWLSSILCAHIGHQTFHISCHYNLHHYLFLLGDSKLPRPRVFCLFVKTTCYFYTNTEAAPILQTSLIAPELFTALLPYKVWVSFSSRRFCAVSVGLLPWPLLTTFALLSFSDFSPSGLDFLLLLTPAPTW